MLREIELSFPAYDQFETEVAECRRELAGIIKASKTAHSTVKWTDPDFPPNETSIWNPSRLHVGVEEASFELPSQWLRFSEWIGPTMGTPLLFAGEPSPDDVVQGALGTRYLLNAMRLLAARFPERLKALFVDYDASVGVCGLVLFIDCRWRRVIIDDCIPFVFGDTPQRNNGNTQANGKLAPTPKRPLYAYSRKGVECWVSLLEKAYAKVHGNYENINGGTMRFAMTDLTGGLYRTLDIVQHGVVMTTSEPVVGSWTIKLFTQNCPTLPKFDDIHCLLVFQGGIIRGIEEFALLGKPLTALCIPPPLSPEGTAPAQPPMSTSSPSRPLTMSGEYYVTDEGRKLRLVVFRGLHPLVDMEGSYNRSRRAFVGDAVVVNSKEKPGFALVPNRAGTAAGASAASTAAPPYHTLWETLSRAVVDTQVAVAASINPEDDEFAALKGGNQVVDVDGLPARLLLPGHLYQVESVFEVVDEGDTEPSRVVRIRTAIVPDMGDGVTHATFTQHFGAQLGNGPAMQKLAAEANAASTTSASVFHMQFEDFVRKFDRIDLFRVPDNAWRVTRFHGMWGEGLCGGLSDYEFTCNPQFGLVVGQTSSASGAPTRVAIRLSQPNTKPHTQGGIDCYPIGIGFRLVVAFLPVSANAGPTPPPPLPLGRIDAEVDHDVPLSHSHVRWIVLANTGPTYEREVALEVDLLPSASTAFARLYYVIPYTSVEGVTMPFDLTILSKGDKVSAFSLDVGPDMIGAVQIAASIAQSAANISMKDSLFTVADVRKRIAAIHADTAGGAEVPTEFIEKRNGRPYLRSLEPGFDAATLRSWFESERDRQCDERRLDIGSAKEDMKVDGWKEIDTKKKSIVHDAAIPVSEELQMFRQFVKSLPDGHWWVNRARNEEDGKFAAVEYGALLDMYLVVKEEEKGAMVFLAEESEPAYEEGVFAKFVARQKSFRLKADKKRQAHLGVIKKDCGGKTEPSESLFTEKALLKTMKETMKHGAAIPNEGIRAGNYKHNPATSPSSNKGGHRRSVSTPSSTASPSGGPCSRACTLF